MSSVYVMISNAEWMEDCGGHEHPPELEYQFPAPPGIEEMDPLAAEAVIHHCLISRGFCLIFADFDWWLEM
jgi:hypothetical protein